ncbi:hypothetical protein ANANG_G00001860, partial [Anguilla anguilla]
MNHTHSLTTPCIAAAGNTGSSSTEYRIIHTKPCQTKSKHCCSHLPQRGTEEITCCVGRSSNVSLGVIWYTSYRGVEGAFICACA